MKHFMTTNGIKRRVLIVDDEKINRELLGAMLSQTYEISFAANGEEAMNALEEPDAGFSLILLDLLMPVMDGFRVIEKCRADDVLRRIPIIVMTSEKDAEVKSIRMGAADFITKPYDMPEVILARCDRIIEMSEDKSLIRSTEHDKVSGLYTREYFFAYLQRLQRTLDAPMDAIVIDIDRFHLVNDLFGREEGDRVLSQIGAMIAQALDTTRGIACRSMNDTFFVFAERKESYDPILSKIQEKLFELSRSRRLRLRAGIYSVNDDTEHPEVWFSRAKAACDRIRGQFESLSTRYNKELYERTVFHEKLIGDVQEAIDNENYVVYFQPKYRIQGERPILCSAEALIRWIHPELGFISPGEFIPLFENNGLIRMVDHYVWRKAAAQIAIWRDRYGLTIPVSVNVSRVDIFDSELENKLTALLDEYAITADDLMLEITESAYADDADRVREVVTALQGRGFKIEMDDFGTGYSSLNTLTDLPIDILKLDMQFIRRMMLDEKSLKLVELVIDIASYLKLPVIAEGVEEEEQLNILKTKGCDIVQGYYFSPPLPAERFANLIEKEIEERNNR